MTNLTDQIAQVRALALETEQKHGGPRRRWEMRSDYLVATDDEVYSYVALANDPTYSRYLVAVQPATVLSVLDHLDALERQVATMRAALEEAEKLVHSVMRDEVVFDRAAFHRAMDLLLTIQAARSPQSASDTGGEQ